MPYAPILLVTGPGEAVRVLVGTEAAQRGAVGSFVARWSRDAVWFDPTSRALGSDGGITLTRWRARLVTPSPRYALVVFVSGRPADVYLVDDVATAERIVLALEGEGIAFALAPIEPLEPPDGSSEAVFDESTVRLVAHGAGRPTPPRAALSSAFCPTCLDQPLHEDPLFDARSASGLRICVACATLAELGRAS
ncbi:MAG TPA: hypothetical protein VNJ28_05975 [Candidatus Limnocylindrales bacterium]|nr:hypothetical protein [Candidatus Limnocylindrales bacterium]